VVVECGGGMLVLTWWVEEEQEEFWPYLHEIESSLGECGHFQDQLAEIRQDLTIVSLVSIDLVVRGVWMSWEEWRREWRGWCPCLAPHDGDVLPPTTTLSTSIVVHSCVICIVSTWNRLLWYGVEVV
jgi:hypothetical protein